MQKAIDALEGLTLKQLKFLNTAVLNEIWIREQVIYKESKSNLNGSEKEWNIVWYWTLKEKNIKSLDGECKCKLKIGQVQDHKGNMKTDMNFEWGIKMNREKFIQELKKENISFTKVRFYKISPYQKRRYKPKYVGWEAWIYNNNTMHGIAITQEDFETNKDFAFESLR